MNPLLRDTFEAYIRGHPRPDFLGSEVFRGFFEAGFWQIPLKQTHPRSQGTRICIILIKEFPDRRQTRKLQTGASLEFQGTAS